jgi:ankyrin repeat protein
VNEKSRSVKELLDYVIDDSCYGDNKEGFGINQRIGNGHLDTALHRYIGWGDIDAVELLLAAGADVNVIDEDGMTPIYTAIRGYQPHIVEIMIKAGANLNHKDDLFGYTPLESAELSMGYVDPKEKANLEKIIALLKNAAKR